MRLVWPLHLCFLVGTGLLVGVVGWHFEPTTLTFHVPALARIETFPLAPYLPGLLVGLVLGRLYRVRWHDMLRRGAVYIRAFFSGFDVIVVGLACLAILMFV